MYIDRFLLIRKSPFRLIIVGRKHSCESARYASLTREQRKATKEAREEINARRRSHIQSLTLLGEPPHVLKASTVVNGSEVWSDLKILVPLYLLA
jgi:hypothetical protein